MAGDRRVVIAGVLWRLVEAGSSSEGSGILEAGRSTPEGSRRAGVGRRECGGRRCPGGGRWEIGEGDGTASTACERP